MIESLLPIIQGTPPEQLLQYGALGIVMATVMGLFRLLERVMHKKNGNGMRELTKAVQQVERSINAATSTLALTHQSVVNNKEIVTGQHKEVLRAVQRVEERLSA